MTRLFCSTTIAAFTLALLASAVHAGFQEGTGRAEVLLGQDDDNIDNLILQPVIPPPNQSLNNADLLSGQGGNDILIGLLGNDVLLGGPGQDIMIGGTEQFDPEGFGNRDMMDGGPGSDVNIWAPGDGSDLFDGGSGQRDAQVFGLIDRDADNVPILSPVAGRHRKTGLPTTDVTGSPGFCELEDVRDTDLGFDFLVRFFVRATGNLAVTIRLIDVEQVFCTSEAGGTITYADLTADTPEFVEIEGAEVGQINRTVGQIIR